MSLLLTLFIFVNPSIFLKIFIPSSRLHFLVSLLAPKIYFNALEQKQILYVINLLPFQLEMRSDISRIWFRKFSRSWGIFRFFLYYHHYSFFWTLTLGLHSDILLLYCSIFFYSSCWLFANSNKLCSTMFSVYVYMYRGVLRMLICLTLCPVLKALFCLITLSVLLKLSFC